MNRSEITDKQVCQAYKEAKEGGWKEWPYDILSRQTGAYWKVCFRAMERAEENGLIEYGVSLRSGWLTEEGKALLLEEVNSGS